MDFQILMMMMALGAIVACSVVAALTMPAIVTTALRGQGRSAVHGVLLVFILAAVAFGIAAIIGANPMVFDRVL